MATATLRGELKEAWSWNDDPANETKKELNDGPKQAAKAEAVKEAAATSSSQDHVPEVHQSTS